MRFTWVKTRPTEAACYDENRALVGTVTYRRDLGDWIGRIGNKSVGYALYEETAREKVETAHRSND